MTAAATLPAPELFRFEPDDGMPNNRTLPVVLVRGAVPGLSAPAICDRMRGNGWRGTWVWTVFGYHHYHPDAHEALCVATGRATLLLGGAAGQAVTVSAGDLVVLPAGTGHRLLEASPDFAICGAYPPGQETYTIRRAGPGAGADAPQIETVPLPATDPLFGAGGPLVTAWRDATKGA